MVVEESAVSDLADQADMRVKRADLCGEMKTSQLAFHCPTYLKVRSNLDTLKVKHQILMLKSMYHYLRNWTQLVVYMMV